MENLIREYGYLAIIFVTFFEGETIVILAGIAASFGQLHCAGVIGSALLGSIAGDQLWYYIGRRWGISLLCRRKSWLSRADKVFAHLKHHETWLILSFRFYYGLRSVTPFAIGAAGVPRLRYFALNVAGAIVWAISFTTIGYLLGIAGLHAEIEFKRYALVGAVVLMVLTGALIWFLQRKRRAVRVGAGFNLTSASGSECTRTPKWRRRDR